MVRQAHHERVLLRVVIVAGIVIDAALTNPSFRRKPESRTLGSRIALFRGISWIPAFAGTTVTWVSDGCRVCPGCVSCRRLLGLPRLCGLPTVAWVAPVVWVADGCRVCPGCVSCRRLPGCPGCVSCRRLPGCPVKTRLTWRPPQPHIQYSPITLYLKAGATGATGATGRRPPAPGRFPNRI